MATVAGSMGAIPMELLGGRLVVSGEVFENVVPMPLSHVGPSKIELESRNEAKIIIEGAGVTATFAGAAEYVEEFEP